MMGGSANSQLTANKVMSFPYPQSANSFVDSLSLDNESWPVLLPSYCR